MESVSLRLLSWNIQCGIASSKTSEYLTRGWRHLLPHKDSAANLRRIAGLASGFDIVALQEVDGGSLRSGFFNQVEYLADMAGFPFWHAQRTRNFAQLGQHGNGLLSRFTLSKVVEHRLPGLVPGRGALEAHIGEGDDALVLCVLHLSLGERARRQQLEYIAERLIKARHLVVMGDMNALSDEVQAALQRGGLCLQPAQLAGPTFPSWKPARGIDHILVSEGLRVQALEVLPYCHSDHLPVAMQLQLPPGVHLGTAAHRAPLVPALPAKRIAKA